MFNEFGTLIKAARKARGLSQDKLAEKCGTHKGYICGIEMGTLNPPSQEITARLARALGLNPKRLILLGWAEKAPSRIRKELVARWTDVATMLNFHAETGNKVLSVSNN